MSYIFDSSSIFRAIKENAVEVLAGNYTLDLARYELGNIIWKEHALHKRINADELRSLVRLVKDVLNLMEILTVNCNEEEILDVSKKLRLTFYDASYICHAKDRQIPLVTEDAELLSKTKLHIKALRLNELI